MSSTTLVKLCCADWAAGWNVGEVCVLMSSWREFMMIDMMSTTGREACFGKNNHISIWFACSWWGGIMHVWYVKSIPLELQSYWYTEQLKAHTRACPNLAMFLGTKVDSRWKAWQKWTLLKYSENHECKRGSCHHTSQCCISSCTKSQGFQCFFDAFQLRTQCDESRPGIRNTSPKIDLNATCEPQLWIAWALMLRVQLAWCDTFVNVHQCPQVKTIFPIWSPFEHYAGWKQHIHANINTNTMIKIQQSSDWSLRLTASLQDTGVILPHDDWP